MNFDIISTDWQLVDDLTDSKTYLLQAKTVVDNMFFKSWSSTNILFTKGSTLPTDNKTGLLDSCFKFTKIADENIYIKAISTPTNIEIQEVE